LGSPEKKTYGYRERDEQKRQAFREQLSKLKPEQIIYCDESGMDERDGQYDYGYSPKGTRLHDLKAGSRHGRVNMIAAWSNGRLFAPFTLEGSCNREVFEVWLEHCLLPELKPNQVLIMDNAAFHKGGRIAEILARAKCEVLYLPPYSPDLNKIEQCWSWLKHRTRKKLPQTSSLREAMDITLREATS
jgi:transposase